MAADPVTPVPGLASVVTVGGTAVEVVGVGPNGGFITNPASSSDQGISPNPESLYVDPTGANPTIGAFGTTFEIVPGGSWLLIPGQTTPTMVNAASSGHRFSVISY